MVYGRYFTTHPIHIEEIPVTQLKLWVDTNILNAFIEDAKKDPLHVACPWEEVKTVNDMIGLVLRNVENSKDFLLYSRFLLKQIGKLLNMRVQCKIMGLELSSPFMRIAKSEKTLRLFIRRDVTDDIIFDYLYGWLNEIIEEKMKSYGEENYQKCLK